MINEIKEFKCKNCKYNLVYENVNCCIKPKRGYYSIRKTKIFCLNKKMEEIDEKNRRNFK